jgi:hypothetical protein
MPSTRLIAAALALAGPAVFKFGRWWRRANELEVDFRKKRDRVERNRMHRMLTRRRPESYPSMSIPP